MPIIYSFLAGAVMGSVVLFFVLKNNEAWIKEQFRKLAKVRVDFR